MYFGFRIAVVYTDTTFRDKWFDFFLSHIDESIISQVRKRKGAVEEVLMKDGSIIQAVDLTTFSKMRRFDRVYVSEKDYDTQAFKVIIEPTLGTRNIFIEYDTNMDRTE